ncbi:MAG: SDR family NAD(P)-dependent oxidoreductase [Alphaproteobacteria bacterium]|nr:SDR family NAD(P)-dependent oxidoreductase [Alphaproteobacteria bacterium]
MTSAKEKNTREKYGPAALVTGASDGIGAAFAEELARQGFDLVLAARRGDRLETMAADMRARFGVDAAVIACDLATPDGVRALIDATRQRDIGLLVAAAGYGTSGDLIDADIATELDMLAVNCGAALALTHAFAQRFAARGGGAIVLMGSLLGFQGVARAAHYAATKAYVQALAEGIRPELRRRGVDVIAAAPGPVASGFAARARMRMAGAARPSVVPRATLKALGRKTTVRPGFLSNLLEFSMIGLPRRGRSFILGRVMASMTPRA